MNGNPKANNSKGTILMVDDEPDVLFFLSKMFQPLGYHTITANSGVEALKYIRNLSTKINLVLLDLRMPEMHGLTVLRVIRMEYPDLPVIVLTGYEEERKEVEQWKVEAFMTKPYSLEDLHGKVVSALKRQEMDAESNTPAPELPEGMVPRGRILIVDDEKEICDLLKSELEDQGGAAKFEVRTATSGEAALKLAQEWEPDIAVVDIKMTHMWGDELIERFKKGEAPCPKDFIIFSAIDDPKERQKLADSGYKFVPKPLNWEKIIATVKKSCIQLGLVGKKT